MLLFSKLGESQEPTILQQQDIGCNKDNDNIKIKTEKVVRLYHKDKYIRVIRKSL